MKKFIITSILGFLITAGTTIKAQNQPDEYLGLPGDNLNLYAVMNLFQESETLEDFERSLNDPDTKINNLDLNGDNLVDYIMVNDYVNGDDHSIVLSVALNANEKQDVGVFTVQRFSNGAVQIQLIGDEALYGNNYIIEPIYDDERPNPGYRGNRNHTTYVRTTTFEVAAWPMIRFIYTPGYPMWHSHWYWGYYPTYWSPWRPFYYHYYYGYHHNWYPMYYQHYRHWNQPRYTQYHNYYYSHLRSYSPQVSSRIRSGGYRTTYSHPEQRREGEMYARSHSRSSRPATMNNQRRNTAENNSMRRSSNTVPNRGQNAGRQERSVNNRNSVNERQNNGNGVSRRSSSPVNDRNGSTVNQGNNRTVNDRNGRSANQGSNRTVNDRNGRSANQGSNRSVMNPSSEQKTRQTGRTNSNVNNNTTVNSRQQRSYSPERSSTVNNRSSRNESVSRNSESPRRSPAVSERSSQKGESAKASRQTRSQSGSRTKESKSESGSRKSSDSSKSERSGRR